MKSIKKAANKVGDAASNAADGANMEAQWVSRKSRNDFPHKGEVAEDVKKLTQYTSHGCKGKFDSWVSIHKNLSEQEQRVGEEFKKANLGSANMCMDHFGSGQNAIHDAHKELITALSAIKDEWQKLDNEHHKVHGTHDKLNRALHEKKFHKEKKNEKERDEAKKKYKELAAEFHTQVDTLVTAYESKIFGWMDAASKAQVAFYNRCAHAASN